MNAVACVLGNKSTAVSDVLLLSEDEVSTSIALLVSSDLASITDWMYLAH